MIKFILKAKDRVSGKNYKIGDEVDLGKERNESAVSAKLAVYVDAKAFQEEITEKVEKAPKNKSKKQIETK